MNTPDEQTKSPAKLRLVEKIPGAWKALAALSYLSWIFGLGLVAPFALWNLYPKSRFLRTHALNAGIIHLLGLLVLAPFYLANFFFIYESAGGMASWEAFLGQLASEAQIGIFLMVMQSIAFLYFALLTVARARRRRRDAPGLDGARAGLNMFLAILLVTGLLYNNVLWPSQAITGVNYIQPIEWARFRIDPYLLIPGHFIALLCFYFALIAMRGAIVRVWPAEWLFVRFARDARARGRKRVRAARLRALLLPGWGQFQAGRPVSGITTLCIFLLLALFFTLSLALNYGRFAENVPGLNANAAWYLLGDLGLKAHMLPDAAFKAMFGNLITLGVLAFALVLCWVYAWWSAGAQMRARKPGELKFSLPHSVLLHVAPVAILLLIPRDIMLQRPAAASAPPDPVRVIPEFFEMPNKDMELNGSRPSGDKSKTYGKKGGRPSKERLARKRKGPGTRYMRPGDLGAGGKKDDRLLLDERRGKDIKGGRPGDRRDMTYSNYISAKIRGVEKGFNYWSSMPRPYHAVFEYKVSSSGDIYDVRVLEPSGHKWADDLTVRLIKGMGIVLPPPGGGHAIVTELFWNTSPSDDGLPTPLQRRLSRAFDGRVIQRF